MHRLKRAASDVADSDNLNPFCRLRQYHRKAMREGRSSTEAMISRDSPTADPGSGSESESAHGVSQVPASPARMRTSNMEEGRLHNSQPDGYYSEKERKEHKSIFGQIKTALFNSWINVLLVFAPVGIAIHYAGVDPTIVFVINFIAIVPLAALLSYGTEEIALYCGEVLGGLLSASFGNAVELIVSIIALSKHEIVIVQTSLIGSILSNLLLVLGMSFIAGGFNRIEQNFNKTVAQTAASLLALAVGSLIVPTAFHLATADGDVGITELSRGTAIILLLVYGSYLAFQLKTHNHLYNTPSEKSPKRERNSLSKTANTSDVAVTGGPKPKPSEQEPSEQELSAREPGIEVAQGGPDLTLWAAVILLVLATVLVAICAECLVDSIDHLVTSAGISRVFVGLILLPIVGNAAEHATAVTVATKDKMDLSIAVAVGSSMQIALLVIPLVVVLGWIMGIDEMTLYFDGFQVMILFVSVLLVNYLIQDGKSNYLEGNLLVAMYLIIGIASWFYPKNGTLAASITPN